MSSRQWRFADFRLDLDNACLWRGAQPVALTPKAFDVLQYLVTHADRLVMKDTLLDAVWPETAISDAVVRMAIGELRRVLGDTAQAPRFIATVHRRGYRFVAPVVEHTEAGAGPASPVPPAGPQTLLVAPPVASTPPGARVRACPACQHGNPASAQFCAACAAPLVVPCPTCGQDNLPGAVFCQTCTMALTNPVSPLPPQEALAVPLPARAVHAPVTLPSPEAERRRLTVLFCNLVNSTTLAGHLDPEDLREVVRAYHQTCAAVIHLFDGYIAQYLGDGILVYFGYPRAHEDDAQRAVRTGLGILQAMVPLNTRLPLPPGERLAVRLGIHTGLVVVGEVGAGPRQEPLALGETPNLAARLQGLAAPNTLMVSAATWQLLGGFFACRVLGPVRLHGRAQPLEAYQVLAETTARSRLEAAGRTGLTPLVGREQEVGLLQERWAQVKDGMGQVVLLSGEAGIGKSRLVQVLQDYVATEAQAWLTPCQCSPYYQHTTLYPMIELLERVALRFDREESPQQKLRKLEGFVVQYGLPMAETVPLLATLLSLPLMADYAPLAVSPEQQKQQTLHALLTIFLRIAAQQPVLFVMEDLHWVDPSTLELLSLLVDQGPTARILALWTFRPDFSPPWTGRAHLTQVTLARLPRRQAAELTGRVAHSKVLPAEVVEQIVAKTDGVPLFVEELTKMLLESDLLQERDGHYDLTGPLPPLAIPTTLHDSLMARLDRLGVVKGLAQLGATLGHEFAYALLQAVAPWDEVTVRRGLQQLVEAELLYQRGLPPQATYVFKHALIQDAAYQSLLKRTRQQYHQHIAQVLEAQFPELCDTQPELLAHHYTEAGAMAQAVPYWQQAGQRAIERSAHLEAIGHLTRGLEVLKTLPDTPDRTRQELDAQTALGLALRAIHGWSAPEAVQAYTRAWELCQQVGETPQRFPVLFGLWTSSIVRPEFQTASALGEQLLSLGQRASNPTLVLQAHWVMGFTLLFMGAFASARAHLDHVMTLYNPQQHRSHTLLYGQDPGVTSLYGTALALWYLGYPDQALRTGQQAVTLAQHLSHPFSVVFALEGVAEIYQFRREGQRTQERAEALMTIATAQRFAFWLVSAQVLRGWILAEQGHGAEGIAQIRQGLAAWQAMGEALYQPRFRALLAELYGNMGQTEAGLAVLAEVLAEVHTTGLCYCEAELYRLKGVLLQAVGESSEAEACFHQALAVARRQQARSWELRAATSLAQLWQQQGKRAAAHALLAPVYGWFTEGFDTADLLDAQTLLSLLATEPYE
jgi:class 3 adenylate cyclase/DNA-binding winged helix-turn-helix (wHTH) protein/predicted ATPase